MQNESNLPAVPAAADLQIRTSDHVTAALKAALGAVPFAGSVLTELIGAIVPNQRVDRIADFAARLERELIDMERDAIRAQLTNENFTDLMQESIRQAAHAVTEKRRAYLAKLLATGVNEERAAFVESRYLLRLLGEINDIEIIWLRYFMCPLLDGDHEFRAKHADVLDPVVVTLDMTDQRLIDRQALQRNYLQHLVSLGLLWQPLLDGADRQPKFDRAAHQWATGSHELTGLGQLLLRHIGFDEGVA